MLTIGEAAPRFSCKAYGPSGKRDVSLSDNAGKWQILLFYVTDLSPICPMEVIELNKEHENFSSQGFEFLGISVDSIEVHKKFSEESLGIKLKFPLLSDTDGKLGKSYGVFNEEKKNDRRATFIIDPDLKIRYFCVSDNKIGRSTKEIYRVAMALKSGEACTVNWEPKD